MTDEELKNIEQTTALLVENGFVIKDTSNFIREVGYENLGDVINRLNGLQATIDEGVNAETFGKDIAASLDGIEEVINNDAYFKMSPEATSFQNLLNDLRDKSSKLFRNTIKAEEILKGREETLKDIQMRIFKLKTDKTIDDATRTSETIRLSYALNHAQKSKEEALKFYNDQKVLSEKPINANDIVEYKNELLQAINTLDNAFRKLSMEPEKMDKLAAFIRETRDKIVLFGFETQKTQKEFDELCERCGLEKNETKAEEVAKTLANQKLEDSEEIEETPVEEKTEEVPEVIKEPATEEKTENNIKNFDDLVSELKRLNPDIELADSGIVVEDPSKLKCPEGFKYTEGLGVNNKANDSTPYICAFVKTKEKEVIAEETKSENIEESKPKTESKIPNGKLKIKRVRRAQIAPYVKAILCYGGIGGILVAGMGIGLSPIGVGVIAGAGIGAIAQKISNKMIESGAVNVPQVNLENPNVAMPGFGSVIAANGFLKTGSAVVEHSKALLKNLRENQKRKKEEALAAKAKQNESEEEKAHLFENFRNQLDASLNNEVESLDSERKDQPVENKNMQDGNLEPVRRPEIDTIAGEEYNLNESHGGR
mgnify:CR=1 FL=1